MPSTPASSSATQSWLASQSGQSETARARGTRSKRRLISEGHEVEAVDLRGAFWIDVDTPEEARRAARLLVGRAAAKSADGTVARHLNRRLSRPLSLLLLRFGASPTAVTVAGFLLTLAAATALALGSVWELALIVGGVLVQAASVVDGVDGEIARASLRSSPTGAFLDSVLDRAADAAVLAGLAVAAGLDAVTFAAFAAALFGTLQAPYVKASYTASFARALPPSKYGLGASRDVRLFVIAVLAVALQPLLGLALIAVLANAEAARRLVAGWQAREPQHTPQSRRLPSHGCRSPPQSKLGRSRSRRRGPTRPRLKLTTTTAATNAGSAARSTWV